MNRRGDALILVIGLLALFLVAVLTYLTLGRTGAKIAAFSLQEVKAREVAEIGIAEALLRLKNDDPKIDHCGEAWHQDFTGDQVDNDEDGFAESGWFLVKKGTRISGRYAVLVEDESAKVNVNACGNISRNGCQGVNEGWKTDEIALESLPGVKPEIAAGAVLWRYGNNRLPGAAGDDDSDNALLVSDGIDNNGNGLTDEGGEGVNEPDEFSSGKPVGDDRPFLSPEDLKEVSGVGPETYQRIKNLVGLFSYDKNVDSEGSMRIDLNRASLRDLEEGLRRCGFTNEAQICQLAVNIKDFRDGDDVPSSEIDPEGNFYYGLEKTPYFNEIEPAPDLEEKWEGTLFTFWWSKGEFVELFNPYPQAVPISGWKVDIGNLVSFDIREGAVAPAGGYYTVGDRLYFWVAINYGVWPPQIYIVPFFVPEPSGCDQYEEFISIPMLGAKMSLFNDRSDTIETTNYGPDTFGKVTKQKNDPRMRGVLDWFPGPASPNKQNGLFLPEVGLEVSRLNSAGHFIIKNRPFSQVGEIGCIHQMRQWQTISLWRDGEPDLATQDVFTVSSPVNEPVPGRININTAPPEVLKCLPFIGPDGAAALVSGRPYSQIGSVGPKLDSASGGLKILGHNFRDDDGDGYVDEDDERELPYRRISNLITVRSNAFRITVTGQSVEDFNGNGKIEDNEVLAEKKITAVYDRGRKRRKFLSWKVK